MNNNLTDRISGKTKEVIGKVTGDKKMEAEGKTQHAKGEVKKKAEEIKDSVSGAIDGLGKDDRDPDRL